MYIMFFFCLRENRYQWVSLYDAMRPMPHVYLKRARIIKMKISSSELLLLLM